MDLPQCNVVESEEGCTSWLKSCVGNMHNSYRQCRNELSLLNGCIVQGNKVIILLEGRIKVMDLLHEGHPGTIRMKTLACSFVCWPRIDHDLEHKKKECDICQHVTAVHKRFYIFGNFHVVLVRGYMRIWLVNFIGKMFLILIDAFSMWLEVKLLTVATSVVTIKHLRGIFTTHGLPEVLVTDNGTPSPVQSWNL